MRGKRFIVNLAAMVLLALLLSSCTGGQIRMSFLQGDEIKLQVGRKVQFRYDEKTCQMAFSGERKLFRAHTDNMSDYYIVGLSQIPDSEGMTLAADLTWTTDTDVLSRKNLALEVLRIEGEKVWLWSDAARIGFCIVILE